MAFDHTSLPTLWDRRTCCQLGEVTYRIYRRVCFTSCLCTIRTILVHARAFATGQLNLAAMDTIYSSQIGRWWIWAAPSWIWSLSMSDDPKFCRHFLAIWTASWRRVAVARGTSTVYPWTCIEPRQTSVMCQSSCRRWPYSPLFSIFVYQSGSPELPVARLCLVCIQQRGLLRDAVYFL